jgi:hypothetical protein
MKSEEALTGRCGPCSGWMEEVVGDGEMSLSSAVTVAQRAWVQTGVTGVTMGSVAFEYQLL